MSGSPPACQCLAAVVRGPVGRTALCQGVGEHLILLGRAGVPVVGRVAAVRCPGAGAELVRAVVATRIRRLVVATRLTGPHARAERAARCSALIHRSRGAWRGSGTPRLSRGLRDRDPLASPGLPREPPREPLPCSDLVWVSSDELDVGG